MYDASDKLSSFALRGLFLKLRNYLYMYCNRVVSYLPEGILSHHQLETFFMSNTPVIEVNIFWSFSLTYCSLLVNHFESWIWSCFVAPPSCFTLFCTWLVYCSVHQCLLLNIHRNQTIWQNFLVKYRDNVYTFNIHI